MKSKVDPKFSAAVIVPLVGLLSLVLLSGISVFAADKSSEEKTASGAAASAPAKRDFPIQTIYDAKQANVEAVADSLEYNKESGKMIARGNAVITYQRTKLLADYAEVETDTKKAYAKGHVMIFEGDSPRLQGEEAYYDFSNHTGSFPNARAISAPGALTTQKGPPDPRLKPGDMGGTWYARGAEIHQIREGVDKIKKGRVTTCSYDKPHYEIRCTKATLYTNVKLVMYNATIYVLGKPVFWWPYVTVPLDMPTLPFQVSPGYSKQFGGYIELTKGIAFNKYLWGQAHLDWRAKRGVGGGWDQYYNFGKYAHGNVKLYVTQDKEAPTPGYRDVGSDEDNPYAKREDRTRGRITWRHRSDFGENTNVILRYHRVADEYFLQDFFEREYRAEMQPFSFVTGTHNTERYGAMVFLEKKMNSYESVVERLPEVRLDWKNQPFLKDWVYNESRVQFDNLYKTYSHSTEQQDSIRTDAYSRWYLPLKWKEIKLTPFAGYRGTEYSHQAHSNSATYRNIFEYGADLRTHFYKTHDVSFDKLGIEVNQLRHIVEPSVRYEGAYSTVAMDRLTRFDTADALDDTQNITLGLENRLQTKRMVGGRTKRVDIVSLNTYVQYEGQPLDPTISGSRFTFVGGELTLRPYEWLQYQARLQYDFAHHYLKVANQDIMIRRGKLRFLFGQRFTHNYYDWYDAQWIEGSEQFVFDTRYQINHLWEVGGYIRWQTGGDGLQEWQVSAARDLHDFILEFGYTVRNSLIDSNNNQLYFNFRMKGFPDLALRNGSKASFSEPRIGETVAGANEFATGLMNPAESQLISLQT